MDRDYSRQEVLDIIEREAGRSGISRDEFLRFAYIETGGRFDEHASRGPGGAKGLFQFVPGTAAQYGIAGREFDAVENTRAAARLYLDNREALVNRHARDDRPYLSGGGEPEGLDMYLAHQQGAGGYRSIQAAIATGEFRLAGTRANILNNVSARDIEDITGHGIADFRAMSDREMAQTFVEYWDAKFDRVRIPEKGIEPIVAGQAAPAPIQAEPGIALSSAHAMTLAYDHVKYGFGIKDPDSGRVDCSGWVVALQNATMDEINGKAGRSVFSRADRFSPGFDSAAAILEKAEARSGMLLEGAAITPDILREGMVIGEDNGPKSWDRGRFQGIDHVVMVVRDPASGELMVSQSRGGAGVELSRLDDYLEAKQARGVKLFASDPLIEARELLQEQARGEQRDQGSSGAVREPAQRSAMADGLLREGERGEDVRRLQERLSDLGYNGRNGRALSPDGAFGPETLHAVRAYQRDHGLDVDGIAGPHTLQSIKGSQALKAAEAGCERGGAGEDSPVSRLDGLFAGQVDVLAKQAWQRDVATARGYASMDKGAQGVTLQDEPEQYRQAGPER